MIKFRAWNGNGMVYGGFSIHATGEVVDIEHELTGLPFDREFPVMHSIGLEDCADKEFYTGDIAEFDNGDRFYLDVEGWLEVYPIWIGTPECEDQARDLYRISRAKIIGNIHANPELVED